MCLSTNGDDVDADEGQVIFIRETSLEICDGDVTDASRSRAFCGWLAPTRVGRLFVPLLHPSTTTVVSPPPPGSVAPSFPPPTNPHSSSTMAGFLDQYTPGEVIGTGSFGIIRKVTRLSDNQIFARKELNFERMSDRDRKQIVSEVNILKDLHHEHIVRYHDRYVDREGGTIYILMEYCGGGDLSGVIKGAVRSGRLIPEDTVWSYFMQILLALSHCHHPPASSGGGHGRTSSAGSGGEEGGRRAQILHRDLKPDNGASPLLFLPPLSY